MKYVKISTAKFEMRLLNKKDKEAAVLAILEAINAYGEGEPADEILSYLCEFHKANLSKAWLSGEDVVVA